MMEEIKLWLSIIGQFGLPLVIAVWYLAYELPSQRKRELKRQEDFDLYLKAVLAEQRISFDTSRTEDKKHALEIQKLAGDIHLQANKEMSCSIDRQTTEVKEMREKLEEALDEFSRHPGRRQGKRGQTKPDEAEQGGLRPPP